MSTPIVFVGHVDATGSVSQDGIPDYVFSLPLPGDFSPTSLQSNIGTPDFSSSSSYDIPLVGTGLPSIVSDVPVSDPNDAPLVHLLTFSDGSKRFMLYQAANAGVPIGNDNFRALKPTVPYANTSGGWILPKSVTDYKTGATQYFYHHVHNEGIPLAQGILMVAASAVGFSAIGAGVDAANAAATGIETATTPAATSASAFGPVGASPVTSVTDMIASGAGVPVTQTVATGTVAATAGIASPALTGASMASGVAAAFSGASQVGAALAETAATTATVSQAASTVENLTSTAPASPATPLAPAPTAADTVAFTGGTASDVGGAAASASGTASAIEGAVSTASSAAPALGAASTGMSMAQIAGTVSSVVGAAKAIESLTNRAPQSATMAQQPAAQNTGGLTPSYTPLISQLAIPAALALAAFFLS
jgi:hypothetical protein